MKRVLGVLVLLMIGFVSAGTYYVSPTGQAAWGDCDGNVALNGVAACSAQTAMDNVKAGDLIYFREGVYHKRLSFKNDGADSEEDRIIISGYPGDKLPVIDGEYNLPNFGSCNTDADCTRFSGLKCDINYHVCGNGRCDPISGNCFNEDGLINIRGKYITIKGFEVTRSFGRGINILMEAGEIVVRDCVVHDNRGTGVIIYKALPNHLIENNSIWESANFARYSRSARKLDWPGGFAWRVTKNVTAKNNRVFHNWGEGIMPMGSSGSRIIGNIVYDNYAAEIYLATSPNTLIEGNLVFNSGDSTYFRSGKPCAGIWFEDEPSQCNMSRNLAPRSDNMTIINNLVAGNGVNIWASGGCWNYSEKNTIRSIIANNILIDATGESLDLTKKPGQNNIIRVYNNIIYREDDVNISVTDSATGNITFSNNIWSSIPIFPNNVNRFDNLLIENPGIVKLDQIHNIQPGEKMFAEWFRINEVSPARNNGKVLPEVLLDYFGKVRDNTPDIGAIEYGGAQIPPTQENCNNNIDDDNDGLIDCLDSNCPACVIIPPVAGSCVGTKLFYDFNDGDVAGKIGNGYSLSGSNFIEKDLNLSSGDKVSVSFWFRPSSISNQILLESSENYNLVRDGFVIFMRSDGFVDFALRGDVGYSVWRSNVSLVSGNWYHFVGVFDKGLSSGEVVGYVNGVPNGSLVTANNNVGNFGENTFYVGARGGISGFANGVVDEVGVFDRALSSVEVGDVYLNGISCDVVSLANIFTKIAEWKAGRISLDDVFVVIRAWGEGGWL